MANFLKEKSQLVQHYNLLADNIEGFVYKHLHYTQKVSYNTIFTSEM